jgi:hypothetical protein
MDALEQSVQEMEEELRQLAVKIWSDLSKPSVSPPRKRTVRKQEAGARRRRTLETSHAA